MMNDKMIQLRMFKKRLLQLLGWSAGTDEQILAYIEGLVIGQKSFEEELSTYRTDNYIKGENLETLKKQLGELEKIHAGYNARNVESVELGEGKVEICQGNDNGVPAIMFGRNGNGIVGSDMPPRGPFTECECLASIKFGNAESFRAVEEIMYDLKKRCFPELIKKVPTIMQIKQAIINTTHEPDENGRPVQTLDAISKNIHRLLVGEDGE